MNTATNRWLLAVGKIFTEVARIILAVGWVIPIIAVVIHLLILAANTIGYQGETIITDWREAVELFIAFLVFLPAYIFFGRLKNIIDSVNTNSVFEPSTANHLTAMAWYLFASQSVLTVYIIWSFFADTSPDNEAVIKNVTEIFLVLPSYLLVIVLLILAGVFRQGATMREDLEGTV